MIATTELRWCEVCAAETVFDRFDCGDHAGDCLELVCSTCGAGIETAGFAPVATTAGGAEPAATRREAAA